MRGMMQRSVAKRLSQVVVSTLAMCIGLAGGASSAWAGAGFGIVPTVPANVTVGQTGVPSSLTITNISTNGPGEVGYETDSFRLTDITFVPSCGSQISSADCPVGSWDPGSIVPAPLTATGRAGTACAGRTFTITLIDPLQGKYRFTPDADIIIGPSSGTLAERRCIIDFTVAVVRTPAIDSDAPEAGIQTDQKAFVAAIDIGPTNTGQTAGGIGLSQTTVALATPAIATQASPTIALGGGTLTDTATVTGLVNPLTGAGAGTVTFTLYGPNDATCATPILTRTGRPLTLNGAATSGTADSGAGFAPSAAGTYRWIASYTGDANNAAVQGTCASANEQTVVARATPSIATQAAPTSVQLGQGALSDTATVSGLVNPVTGAGAGTVTFTLYGPNDPGCTTPRMTATGRPLTLNGAGTAGTATSGVGFTPPAAGTYSWVASYSGDVNNAPVSGACGDVNEQTIVTPPPPPPCVEDGAVTQTNEGTVTQGSNTATGGNATATGGNGGDASSANTVTDNGILGSSGTITMGGDTETESGNARGGDGGNATAIAGDATASNTAVQTQQNRCGGAAGTAGVVSATSPPPPPPPAQAAAADTAGVLSATLSPPAPASVQAAVVEVASPGEPATTGTTACRDTPFNVVVSGRHVARVIFTVDGRAVRTLTRPNRGSRYALLVKPSALAGGRHRVLARVSFRRRSAGAAKTLRVVFNRCAPGGS